VCFTLKKRKRQQTHALARSHAHENWPFYSFLDAADKPILTSVAASEEERRREERGWLVRAFAC